MLLDFGHSNIFPGTDTFPCILTVLKPNGISLINQSIFFTDVSDKNRGSNTLENHINEIGYDIPISNLYSSGWVLEPPGVSELIEKLRTDYPKVEKNKNISAYMGIKTGYNTALYIDTITRNSLIDLDPGCSSMIHKLLRGRALDRWVPSWEGDWIIGIPSSANINWPWSHSNSPKEAEEIFEVTYPSLYNHLVKHKEKLTNRVDQGQFWWELRSCDFYEKLGEPKIIFQRILFHSNVCLDQSGHWVNDSTVFITTGDKYLLALLNSRVLWWYIFRVWPHMKDEAVRVQNQKVLELPCPQADRSLQSKIVALVQEIAVSRNTTNNTYEVLAQEEELNKLIYDAFSLSNSEKQLIEKTLPPRDPLEVAKRRLLKS